MPAAPRTARPIGRACDPQVTPVVPPWPATPFHPTNPGPGLTSLAARESGAKVQPPLVTLPKLMLVFCLNNALFQAAMALFTSGSCSAKLGARNDVPQAPRMVRP